jgi:hypothetical protein
MCTFVATEQRQLKTTKSNTKSTGRVRKGLQGLRLTPPAHSRLFWMLLLLYLAATKNNSHFQQLRNVTWRD